MSAVESKNTEQDNRLTALEEAGSGVEVVNVKQILFSHKSAYTRPAGSASFSSTSSLSSALLPSGGTYTTNRKLMYDKNNNNFVDFTLYSLSAKETESAQDYLKNDLGWSTAYRATITTYYTTAINNLLQSLVGMKIIEADVSFTYSSLKIYIYPSQAFVATGSDGTQDYVYPYINGNPYVTGAMDSNGVITSVNTFNSTVYGFMKQKLTSPSWTEYTYNESSSSTMGVNIVVEGLNASISGVQIATL